MFLPVYAGCILQKINLHLGWLWKCFIEVKAVRKPGATATCGVVGFQTHAVRAWYNTEFPQKPHEQVEKYGKSLAKLIQPLLLNFRGTTMFSTFKYTIYYLLTVLQLIELA